MTDSLKVGVAIDSSKYGLLFNMILKNHGLFTAMTRIPFDQRRQRLLRRSNAGYGRIAISTCKWVEIAFHAEDGFEEADGSIRGGFDKAEGMQLKKFALSVTPAMKLLPIAEKRFGI